MWTSDSSPTTDKIGINFAFISGKRDLDAGKLLLKNMRTSEESNVSLEGIEQLGLSVYR